MLETLGCWRCWSHETSVKDNYFQSGKILREEKEGDRESGGGGINRQTNGQTETKRDTERGLAGRKALSVETSKLFGIIHGFTRL